METHTVHFSLGANAGRVVMEIAQEHLLYDYNPKQALETFTRSFNGMSNELAKKILVGKELIIVPDEDGVSIDVTERPDDSDYPIIDIDSWVANKASWIAETGRALRNDLAAYIKTVSWKGTRDRVAHFSTELQLKDLYEVFVTQDASAKDRFINSLMTDIEESEGVMKSIDVLKYAREWCSQVMRTKNVMNFMLQELGANEPKATEEELSELCMRTNDAENFKLYDVIILDVYKQLQACVDIIFYGDVKNINGSLKELKNFIDTQKEMQQYLTGSTIRPRDITKGYDAGWLAPNGDFYGLNGETACLLHLNIAQALSEAGIIKGNDTAIEREGWIRIHHDSVRYWGFRKDNMAFIPPTQQQIDALIKYANACYKGVLYINGGIPTTTAKLQMVERPMLERVFSI